jgi:serine/threonine protein kinase
LFKAETEAQQLHAIFEFVYNFFIKIKFLFRKIGTPKPNLWPQDAIVSRVSFPEYKPIHLTMFAPRLPSLALNLITQIFHFNPHERPTALECLQHEYFV